MEIEDIKKNIAFSIFSIMEKYDMTQSQLASALGIAQGRLSRYINSGELAKIDFLVNLANFAGLSVDSIIHYKKEEIMSEKKLDNNVINSNITNNGKGNINSTITGDVYNNTVVRKRIEYAPQPDDLSQEQAAKIKELVNNIVIEEQKVKQKPKSHAAVWTALKKYMKVTTYLAIKKDDYQKAEMYLSKWIGRLKSMPSHIKHDPDKHRRDRYKAINAALKTNLGWSSIDLNNYIYANFDGRNSLKELTIDELERLYSYVFRLKSLKKNNK